MKFTPFAHSVDTVKCRIYTAIVSGTYFIITFDYVFVDWIYTTWEIHGNSISWNVYVLNVSNKRWSLQEFESIEAVIENETRQTNFPINLLKRQVFRVKIGNNEWRHSFPEQNNIPACILSLSLHYYFIV